MTTNDKKTLMIIDGHGLVHRAYHAIPPMNAPTGEPVNAAFGVTSMTLKLLQEFKPDYVCIAFDRPGESVRVNDFVNYKAQRVKKEDDFYQQIPYIEECAQALGVTVIESLEPGYEADDVIGSISQQVIQTTKDIKVLIVSSDQDILQLVNDRVNVLAFKKGFSESVIYNTEEVKNKYGFLPEQIIDFKALRGDPSDNIPGVKGIGEKTASQLIIDLNNLDNIYKNLDDAQLSPRQKELIKNQKDDAYLSKKLVTIKTDLKTNFQLNDSFWQLPAIETTAEVFQKYGFKSLIDRLSRNFKNTVTKQTNAEMDIDEALSLQTKTNDKGKWQQDYRIVKTQSDLDQLIQQLTKADLIVVDTETTSLDTLKANLLGISFCWQPGLAYFVDCQSIKNVPEQLKNIFEQQKKAVIGHNIKYDYKILKRFGLELTNIYSDTLIEAYIAFGSERALGLDALVFNELGYQMQPITDLIGPNGPKQINLDQVEVEKVGWYSCEDVDFTLRLHQIIEPQLKNEDKKILKEIEIPLIKILAEMEDNGILVDKNYLASIQKDFAKELNDLEQRITKLAGYEFNLNSPSQLADILFNKINLPTAGLKKTKTGISTAAQELEKLINEHEIISLIIQYREYSKLQNTYIETLPEQLDKNGRVHTSFNQTITATGRLSSSDPNLQNIPIRSELGKKIRGAFIASDNNLLISADYSQIELRIAASLAQEQTMIAAFNSGADIHRDTAGKIFNIKLEEVTSEQRSIAKTINFGILYGLGAFGLAQRVNISRMQAKKFIDDYFSAFPNLKKWRDQAIESARQLGYAQTIFGRRRYLVNINSPAAQLRAGAERMAINMPIQGANADIIKLAMIKLYDDLKEKYPEVKMLVQVHDELVFECPQNQVDEVSDYINKVMTTVCQLDVPIVVDIATGKRWNDC